MRPDLEGHGVRIAGTAGGTIGANACPPHGGQALTILRGFLNQDNTIDQIGLGQSALESHLPIHQVGDDDHIVLALNAHDVLHHHVLRGLAVLVDGRKTHISFLPSGQSLQNGRQAEITLLKVGHCQHNLLIGGVLTGTLQLLGQSCQLPGVGGVMTHHIFHQGGQLLHRGMLAATGAAGAVTPVAMGTLVVVTMAVIAAVVVVMVVAVVMVIVSVLMIGSTGDGMGMGLGAMLVGVRIGVGVRVIVAMVMAVLMAVGMGIGVGVLRAGTDMIVIQMHSMILLGFFLIITHR